MMTRAYDTRPDLPSYDALTMRGIARFAIAVGLLIGIQLVADSFGLSTQLHSAIQLAWVVIGITAMWVGGKALVTGEELPDRPAGPRYGETSLRFVSQRMLAIGELAGGAFLVADSIYKLFEILPE